MPTLPDAIDVARLAKTLDRLLVIGSGSHLSVRRYGDADDGVRNDIDRDEVALRFPAAIIAAEKLMFGICGNAEVQRSVRG